jgi:3-hydroxyacyl-CoA dehydrogenase/enoyl-CoA hydratase/3-hydroxybutyryl-CoA epimerase
MDSFLKISRDADNVVTLTMDSPGKPVNTFSPQMLAELSTAIDELERSHPAGVIFASAKNRSFSAGADLFEVRKMNPEQLGEYLARGQALFERIAQLPFPTVAAINGDCLGGACELALACKIRVAVDDASVSIGLPEVKLGLIPAWGGTTRLPRLLGLRRALPILLAGKTMPPRKAVKVGLIDEVVRPEALIAAANRLVRTPKPDRHLPTLDRLIANLPAMRNKILDTARSKTREQTHGNYPAPMALLDVVQIGYENGIAAGLTAERHAILECTATDAGRNLLRLFFLRQGAKKQALSQLHSSKTMSSVPIIAGGEMSSVPISVKPVDVKYAAVIGGGTMGAGIAHALARAGMFVRLVEVDAKAMSAGLRRIKKMLDDDVAAGRLDRLAARQVLNRVSPTIDWTGLELADLVVEAVLETIANKREVFSKLDRLTRPTAVLASNTSSLRIDDIAQATLHPERVIGLHFFNPVPKMPLVEIVRGSHSDEVSLATAVAVAGRLGKTPVLVNDAPGFLVNRILTPYLAEALMMAGEGTPIPAIDQAMKAWGMPMGPFELLDEIGLDIAAHVLKSLENGAAAPASVQKMFAQATAQRWLGKKTGRGFYHHDEKKPTPNAELLETLTAGHPPVVESSDANIKQRLVLPMVNEAAKVLQEHVTDSADTIDLATVMGLGLAPFRGGIVQHANTVGTEKIVGQLEELVVRHGPRFAPAPLLKHAAMDHHALKGVSLPPVEQNKNVVNA